MEITKVRPLTIHTFAVDADIVAYRCAAVNEDKTEEDVYETIDEFMFGMARDTGITKMCMFISPATNFRYGVAKTRPYKETRHRCLYWKTRNKNLSECELYKKCKHIKRQVECKDYETKSPRPKYIEQAKEYIKQVYASVTIDNYEADDAIASYMTAHEGVAHSGIDKDIKQIVGWHYDFVKKEWEYTDPDTAALRMYRQICMGDSTDSIPGLPGIGVKKAEAAIQDPKTAHDDALLLYFKTVKGSREQIMAYWDEQKTLITMVDDLDIPYEKYTVIEPPPVFEDKSEPGDFIISDTEPKRKSIFS